MRFTRPSHGTAVAYLALLVAMSGTAVAATGSTFITGKINNATTTTSLVNPNGTALALRGKTGTPALTVSSSNTAKVPYLNADMLDGLDSSRLQQRISGVCGSGTAVSAVDGGGSVACVALGLGQRTLVTGSYSNIGGYAACPSGFTVVGGGYQPTGPTTSYVVGSYPSGDAFSGYGWSVTTNPPSGQTASGTVYAICLK